ncbi:MAG: 6-pyruvoyl tetrahydropterin synthase family protein [Bacteroidales bacterium]|jgi:6-pyruvoyltetrahydropterin/6-carboxytetrahydropterin synthase
MTKLRVTKEFRFEGAHALADYDGKCRFIHGHSYRLFVTLKGTPTENRGEAKCGMVIDFSNLKEIVNQHIVDVYDHALILREDAKLAKEISQTYSNVVVTPFQPTCENLVIHFAQVIKKAIPGNLELHSVKLYETPTSYVEWFANDNQ